MSETKTTASSKLQTVTVILKRAISLLHIEFDTALSFVFFIFLLPQHRDKELFQLP